MAAVNIRKLTNGNVYLDGANFFGAFEQITLPEIQEVSTEHKGLGMIGKLEYPSGFDKMEAKIKWNGPYKTVMLLTADIYQGRRFMVRGSADTYSAAGGRVAQDPIIVNMTGRFKNISGMELKQMENAEQESTISVSSVQLIDSGVEIYYLDFAAMIYRVGGVDLLATYRANLGI